MPRTPSSHIAFMEGYKTTGYFVKKDGVFLNSSGLTVGNGIDLSQISTVKQLVKLGIPKATAKKWKKLGVLGKTYGELISEGKTAAQVNTLAGQVTIPDTPEMKKTLLTKTVERVGKKIKPYKGKMSKESMNTMYSITHWFGNYVDPADFKGNAAFKRKNKSAWKLKQELDKIIEEKGFVSDADFKTALETARDVEGGVSTTKASQISTDNPTGLLSPVNHNTFNREINSHKSNATGLSYVKDYDGELFLDSEGHPVDATSDEGKSIIQAGNGYSATESQIQTEFSTGSIVTSQTGAEEVVGRYDDWSQFELGDHEDGDVVRVGDKFYEYEANRASYAPHNLETGETEDLYDHSPALVHGNTIGSNPEKLRSGRPNPKYRKNRNSNGSYTYKSLDDVKKDKNKNKLQEGDVIIVDDQEYKYDSDTNNLIAFTPTGDLDVDNNVNVDQIGTVVDPVAADPNVVADPNVADPNVADPNVADPNVADPNVVDPNVVDPNVVDPNVVDPNVVDPNVVAEPVVETEPEVVEEEIDLEEESTKQSRIVLGPNGEQIEIEIGEDVSESDIRKKQTGGEQRYKSWKELEDNINKLDKSRPFYIGENRYKWNEEKKKALLVDEKGEYLPDDRQGENEEFQDIFKGPRIKTPGGSKEGESPKEIVEEKIITPPVVEEKEKKEEKYSPLEKGIYQDDEGNIWRKGDEGGWQVKYNRAAKGVPEVNEYGEPSFEMEFKYDKEWSTLSKDDEFDEPWTNTQQFESQLTPYNEGVFKGDVSKEVAEQDPTIDPEYRMKQLGKAGDALFKGANKILDYVGGPGGIISYVMGKKGLKEAMKEVKPQASAQLSPMFMQHLRQSRELAKTGFNPDQTRLLRKEIGGAYQKGLENAVRGSGGQRARFLASSGILDAQRSSALLQYAAKDSELQSKNQEKYEKLMMFKENFDIQQTEKERAEDMERQVANKKAAATFTSAAFTNLMSNFGGNSSLLNKKNVSNIYNTIEGMMNNQGNTGTNE